MYKFAIVSYQKIFFLICRFAAFFCRFCHFAVAAFFFKKSGDDLDTYISTKLIRFEKKWKFDILFINILHQWSCWLFLVFNKKNKQSK
jgi:hypothetical protein